MVLNGNAVSGGVAIGKIYLYQPFDIDVCENFCDAEKKAEQFERFKQVRQEAFNELEKIRCAMEKEDPDKAKIFVAHQDILTDEAITEEILDGIQEELWTGDWAIQKVFSKFVRMLKKVPDPLIRERAADIEDVRKRLLRIWNNEKESNLSALTEPVIVIAHDLLPSDTATLNRNKVLAIITEVGGPTSHSAIIARSYEIPAILGVSGLLSACQSAQIAAVDALTGEIVLEPDTGVIAKYEQKQKVYQKQQQETKAFLATEPLTADGIRIDIGLNIGSADDKELEGAAYTDLVGLFRTEFLYMGRDTLPSEEEQFLIYKKVLQQYGERPVTLRTLDIGGDKTLDSMELPKEDNPFLGNRALRLCFSRPELFKTQLRAALRASVFGNLWLMLPMVGDISDIRRTKDIIAGIKTELDRDGISYNPDMKLGIMIEIPSIAFVADMAVKEVDFASIGTNDLCQYLNAVDRLNPEVACYYRSYHPALFRLIGNVVRTFNTAHKPICVCGEMGGDVLAAPVLIGLGMHKLSMGFASIAPIKRVLSELTIEKAEKLAETAMNLPTTEEVTQYLKEQLQK